MKFLLNLFEAITSPFHLIMKSDNFINHTKPIKLIVLLLGSIIITAGIILFVYKDLIFK